MHSDNAGNLFGTSAGVGAFGAGAVVKLSPGVSDNWKLNVLYDFHGGKTGLNPGGFVVDDKGNLFGAAAEGMKGGGEIYTIRP